MVNPHDMCELDDCIADVDDRSTSVAVRKEGLCTRRIKASSCDDRRLLATKKEGFWLRRKLASEGEEERPLCVENT